MPVRTEDGFSVLAPILAFMLALSAGFRFVMIAGAALYLAVFFAIRRGWGAAEE